jgi:hypothetical protein
MPVRDTSLCWFAALRFGEGNAWEPDPRKDPLLLPMRNNSLGFTPTGRALGEILEKKKLIAVFKNVQV